MCDEALLEAYRKTRYCIDEGDAELRIGECSPKADRLLRVRGVRTAAFITAWNPGSEEQNGVQNEVNNEKLRAEMVALGLHPMTGRGIGEDRNLEPEESYFVPGIERAQAFEIGRKFRQNAIVWHELGKPSELIITAECAS